ncbi:MAG: glycosyltransferase [Janthinobacterium lividum]
MNLVIVQPVFTQYRRAAFEWIGRRLDTTLVVSRAEHSDGFGDATNLDNVKLVTLDKERSVGGVKIQPGVSSFIFRSRPDIVLTFANPRYLTFWLNAWICMLFGIDFIAHGQGLFRHEKPSLFTRTAFRLLLWHVHYYICYNTFCLESTEPWVGQAKSKLRKVENSVTNLFPVVAEQKNYHCNGILFIGRQRDAESLISLIATVERIRNSDGVDLTLNIIGASGDALSNLLRRPLPLWVRAYGTVYDQEEIARISVDCFCACYPGNAGLSVVHYMSLSLAPIVHKNMRDHQGPEPAIVDHMVNGILFDPKSDCIGMESAIHALVMNRELAKELGTAAFERYRVLETTPLGEQFVNILSELKH